MGESPIGAAKPIDEDGQAPRLHTPFKLFRGPAVAPVTPSAVTTDVFRKICIATAPIGVLAFFKHFLQLKE